MAPEQGHNKTIPGDEANDPEQLISDLRVKRRIVQMQITKMRKYVETPGRAMSVPELQTRLGLVEEFWSKFEKLQENLECLDSEELEGDKREAFQDAYIAVKSRIIELMEPTKEANSILSNVSDEMASCAKRKVRLPEMSIKKFSGKYVDWPNYYAKFKTLIEKNEEISSVEKMAYLQESLEEGPLKLISNLNLATDFDTAVATLKARYENKRLIFQSHIRQMMETKPVGKQVEDDLRSVTDAMSSSLRALTNIATTKEILEGCLLHIVCSKVDGESRAKWEDQDITGTYPTWDEWQSFVERRSRVLESGMSYSANSHKTTKFVVSKGSKIQHRKSFVISTSKGNCSLCKHIDHDIENCGQFRKLTPTERFREVKGLKLCIQCLRPGHLVKTCRASSCKECKSRHHTLLHRTKDYNSSDVRRSAETSSPAPLQSHVDAITLTSRAVQGQQSQSSEVLLATAVVLVKNKAGEYISCRALLDSGSSLNFIAERVVQHLQLGKVGADVLVGGIGSTSVPVRFKTNIAIKSRINNFRTCIEAFVLPKISSYQPSQIVKTDDWRIPENIVLADPSYYIPQPIDLLIGAHLFFDLLAVGQIKLGSRLPVLQKTVLGWVISGGEGCQNVAAHHALQIVPSQTEGDNLEKLVQQFWTIDNPKPIGKVLSAEHQACEDLFTNSMIHLNSGRFAVNLPFQKSPQELGSSLDTARKRFFNLEQKLLKSSELGDQYKQFMFEYRQLGHMEKISYEQLPKEHYFIPHHCVLKPESSSTKLRVVFDASCKTSSGLSLNDILMVGPVIQDDLFTLLLRFRSYKFALTADICKMYRQILIRSPDKNLQCILWRSNPQEPLEIFRLLTLTYGTASASFIATRCLKQLAIEEKAAHPVGAAIVERDFYVDDMITGAESLQEARLIQEEVTKVLAAGGFSLSKWCSNSSELLNNIDEDYREKYITINGDNVIKTLGMIWNPNQDEFRFACPIERMHTGKVTKRTVLGAIARFFDPIGLLCPIITKAKIFMQELWKLKLDWDESLPQGLQQQWVAYFEQLEAVKEVKIPRYIIHRSSSLEIHGFADASMNAFGCCIYVRCSETGTIYSNLLTARSKVAPLQTQSIARLELCAALVLAETIERVMHILGGNINHVYCWTDSTIVLAWLDSAPSRWSVFVGNRVSKIQELTRGCSWNYVATDNNPADIVSRGALPLNLIESSLWFHGPGFLLLPKEKWPKYEFNKCPELLEERKIRTSLKVSVEDNFIESHKYSNSFLKMVNTVAYILRFANNARIKTREERDIGPLTLKEIDHATNNIIRVLQKHCLKDEYKLLTAQRCVKPNSPLRVLDPFIDKDGLVRVGGRLANSDLDSETKHQIVLPKSKFAKSLIYYYHYKNLHAGCQTLLAILRSKYWPIGGRVIVKSSIASCVRCFRCRPRTAEQLMGQLPNARVKPSPVFFTTGVDYCGPFFVKGIARNRSPTKAYLCVFVCMSVKAVHLEIVGDLSTESFMSALTKFIARRPFVSKIISDNATNFVGAKRELKELKDLFQSEQHNRLIQEMCKRDGIEWSSIPVRSPNFGGLWESAVKQAKYLLKRALGNNSFSLDELQRLTCQVESIINSRPITPLSNDPNDLECLTPGHFLTGGMMRTIVAPCLKEVKTTHLNRWQALQNKMQHLWARWRSEYLQGVQARYKWKNKQPNLQVGMMVLLKDENVPPLKWPLGRIKSVHKGQDGLVRVVTIHTVAGDTTRAISKVCPLPLDEHYSLLEVDTSKAGDDVGTFDK